jgi:hypothetical protein
VLRERVDSRAEASMKSATVRPAGLALIFGVALAGCSDATSRRADAGAPVDGGVWLAPDDGPAPVADVKAAEDGRAIKDTLATGGVVSTDAALAQDASVPRDGLPPTDVRKDGRVPPDGPVHADGPTPPDLPPPSDGPRLPDVPAPSDLPPPPPDGPAADASGATQVTVAIVGDTAEKGRTSHTRAVAALISGHAPAVAGLLIPGDCARYDGVGSLLSFFQKYWAPASEANMAQLEDIVFPQLGNHEYLEADAQGYFDYFATRLTGIAAWSTYHGDVDRIGRGWYSIDMNAWHIVSLNANCDEISGGCATGGAQEQWLAEDLAEHTGMPTIAFWHQPRWTCTSNGHASASDVQPLWARLYDAHADFVFNGHNHFYQRYKPLNKDSQASEDQTAGITEIIVGTGGSSTYRVCSSSQDTRVAQALDGDGSLGAMFFTMGSDGSYHWEFRLKSDGSVFDSGSGRSHNAN